MVKDHRYWMDLEAGSYVEILPADTAKDRRPYSAEETEMIGTVAKITAIHQSIDNIQVKHPEYSGRWVFRRCELKPVPDVAPTFDVEPTFRFKEGDLVIPVSNSHYPGWDDEDSPVRKMLHTECRIVNKLNDTVSGRVLYGVYESDQSDWWFFTEEDLKPVPQPEARSDKPQTDVQAW